MKKFLRFLLALILIVAVAIVILGIIEPKDIVVSRSTMIKAPKEAVFEQMVLFKNWPNWSPWYKMDSTMKMAYSGTDGQPGSSYHWIGNEKKTGEGEMKNIAVNGTELTFDVTFTKPDRGTAHGTLKAIDTAGMTKATWSFAIHMPFPMNAMCVFMNMDKMLGGDFENGLANMKKYVEAYAAAGSDINVTEVDYAQHTFEGVHKTVGWADIGQLFTDAKYLLTGDAADKINGVSTGLYYTWDTVNKTTNAVAAFPVSDTATPVKGASFIVVPASKAVMAVLKGGYGKEMVTHAAIMKYMTAKGQARSMVVEEYLVGPMQETDTNKWVTNIYYLLKQ